MQHTIIDISPEEPDLILLDEMIPTSNLVVVEIQKLKVELLLMMPKWLDQILDKLGFKILPKAFLDQLRQDMGVEQLDSKLQFINVFEQQFLNMLYTNPNIPKEVVTVQHLILFAQTCLNESLPVIKKHQILRDIVRELNQNISNFFIVNKTRVRDLSQKEERLKQSSVKQQQSNNNIREFIRLDKEQRNRGKTEVDKIKECIRYINARESTQPIIRQAPLTMSVEKCPHCLCSKSIINVSGLVQTNKSPVVQCRICENFFHTLCMKLSVSNSQFMCPECVILRLDPLHHIEHVICEPVPFRPTQHAPTKTFTFTLPSRRENQVVEVRCIRLDGKHGSEEPTWPDIGDMAVNGKRIVEFKPLQNNSSLKKRKDEKYSTNIMMYNSSNVIQLREGVPTADQRLNCRVALGDVYFVGVYMVQQRTAEKLIQDTLSCEESYISVTQSKEMFRLYMQKCSGADVQMQSLRLSLCCHFDTQLMNTPVRGALCEHLQCFSLENMCQMMSRVSPRRWRCPICKSLCFELMIDGYQQLIVKLIKDNNLPIEEVSFYSNGEVEQEELRKLVDGIPMGQFLIPYAVENNNKILQLEQLKKFLDDNKATQDMIIIHEQQPYSPRQEDPDIIEVETFEPPIRKQIIQDNNQSSTQETVNKIPTIGLGESALKRILQSDVNKKGFNNNPIYIE